jgi:hypothetical protein
MKTRARLLLNSETIRLLSSQQLESAVGGLPGSRELPCRDGGCVEDPKGVCASRNSAHSCPTIDPPK